jgi:transposase
MKQKPFKGSNRELRSRILKLIMEKGRTEEEISAHFQKSKIPSLRIKDAIEALLQEGFLELKKKRLRITD